MALEGLLTGVALALGLHVLQQDKAAAAPAVAAGTAADSNAPAGLVQEPEAEESGGGAPHGAVAGGGGAAGGAERGQDPPGADGAGGSAAPTPLGNAPKPAAGAGGAGAPGPGGAAAGSEAAGGGLPPAERGGLATASPGGVEGLEPPWRGGGRWDWEPIDAAQPAGAVDESIPAEATAPEPQGRSLGAPPSPTQPPPKLRIGVSSAIGAVGRSVDGPAALQIRQDQTALADSRIDLDQAPIQNLEISSLRELRGLADSRNGAAGLLQEGQNTALRGATLLGSVRDSDYAIRASDQLRLGLLTEARGSLQVNDAVTAIDGSLIEDPAGSDAISVEAGLQLRLLAPQPGGRSPSAVATGGALEPADQGAGRVDLSSTALRDSVLRLGDGGNRIRITSVLELVSPGTAEATAVATAVAGEAVGLRGSLLDSGGGDDRVTIAAMAGVGASDGEAVGGQALQRHPGLSALALDNAVVRLGAGDDSLEVRGTVRNSLIEPGPGLDRLRVYGSLEDSVLRLDGGGRSLVDLAGGDETLRIEGTGLLRLDAGDGDDRIVVGDAVGGWLDAGGGDDTLELLGAERGGAPAAVAPGPWPSPGLPGPELTLVGGAGEDLFVLPDLDSLLRSLRGDGPDTNGTGAAGAATRPRRTTLLDLSWRDPSDGGPALSDRLALRRGPAPVSGASVSGRQGDEGEPLILLRPSGLEGIGDGRLLPIAPLEQLLSGILDAAPQLAIASGSSGSELVLLEGGGAGQPGAALPLATLPGLRGGQPPCSALIGRGADPSLPGLHGGPA